MTTTTLSKSDESRLQKHLEAIDKAKAGVVDSVIVIGRELAAVREIIPHGDFLDWVATNCGFSKSTAYNYLAAHAKFSNFQRLEHFTPESLYLLAKSEPAVDEAKKLATKGQRIDPAKAKEILAQFQAKVPKKPKKKPIPKIGNGAPEPQATTEVADSETPDPEPGGWEASEAKKPLKKLDDALSAAARHWADANKILGIPDGFKGVWDGIDSATKALAKFGRRK